MFLSSLAKETLKFLLRVTLSVYEIQFFQLEETQNETNTWKVSWDSEINA